MKNPFRKHLLLLLLPLTLLVCGCAATPSIGSKADMTGYEGLTDKTDHVFIVSDANDFIKRLDQKDTFVAYFGFNTCPWCNSMISILNDLGKEYNQEILYINTRPNKRVTANNQIDHYDELYSRIGEYWNIDPETGDNYLFVPFVAFVKNGQVIVSHMGTVEGHIPDMMDLTQEHVAELTQIYSNGFSRLGN